MSNVLIDRILKVFDSVRMDIPPQTIKGKTYTKPTMYPFNRVNIFGTLSHKNSAPQKTLKVSLLAPNSSQKTDTVSQPVTSGLSYDSTASYGMTEVTARVIVTEILDYIAQNHVNIYTAASQADQQALIVNKGDICCRSDINTTYIALATTTVAQTDLSNWTKLGITQTAGYTGSIGYTGADSLVHHLTVVNGLITANS